MEFGTVEAKLGILDVVHVVGSKLGLPQAAHRAPWVTQESEFIRVTLML